MALAKSPEYLMPPSATIGTSPAARGADRLGDGGELRHAHARHHPRRADGARADAHLDRVGAAAISALAPS